MKLAQVQSKAPVGIGGADATKVNFRASDGWELSLEQGTVTIKKGDLVRLVPWTGNIAWADPVMPKAKEGA